MLCYTLIPGILPVIAITAIDGLVAAGLERHLSGAAAAVANYIIHLAVAGTPAVTAITVALVGPAGGAAGRLILKAFFSEESLFRGGEYEFGAAVTAGKGFVGVHRKYLLILPSRFNFVVTNGPTSCHWTCMKPRGTLGTTDTKAQPL